MEVLTPSENVDVGALAGLFNKTTNSYKYLYFQAILSKLYESNFKNKIFDLNDIAVEMAALAWFPHNYFRLSFGLSDQVGNVIDRLSFSLQGRAIGSASNQKNLRKAIQNQYQNIQLESLLRYVPYRLLEPFFKPELSGVPDQKKNKKIQDLSESCYDSRKPLYRFLNSSETLAIELHDSWVHYLYENFSIVRGWAERQWLEYLQRKNPATPAIVAKLKPPVRREPLTSQIKFWNNVFKYNSIYCIYSDRLLNANNYELDHFIPWSFVGHDKIWNLIPALPEANQDKEQNLPHHDYIPKLADVQAKALSIYFFNFKKEQNIDPFIEPYLSDLGLDEYQLTNYSVLKENYWNILTPLISLAKNSGFTPNWSYQGTNK